MDIRQLTLAAAVAALYAVLSYFAGIFGVAYGPIQCRFSEALCVLPFLFPGTAPGLFVGCLIANLLSPYGPIDIICGSAATLIAAFWTAHVKHKWMAAIPPVVCNCVIVGAMLGWYEAGFGPAFPAAFAYNFVTVGIGEVLACCVLGNLLLAVLPRVPFFQTLLPEQRQIQLGLAK